SLRLLLLRRLARACEQIVVNRAEVFRIVVGAGPTRLRLRLSTHQPPPAVRNRSAQPKPQNQPFHRQSSRVVVTSEPIPAGRSNVSTPAAAGNLRGCGSQTP